MTNVTPLPQQAPIIAKMQTSIDRWQSCGDARAVFLSCYSMMTANVLTAVEEDEFHDPTWVTELLHRFAGYYFAAVDAYDDREADAPAVWKIAFDAAQAAENQALQKLLLGVNAHINYDLVLTLVDMLDGEWESLTVAMKRQRYEDHRHVNEVIGRTIDAVQDQVIEPVAPDMDFVDDALGPLDEWLASRMISRWREEVWKNALSWLASTAAVEQEALRRQIEAMTLSRADAILLDKGILGLRHLF